MNIGPAVLLQEHDRARATWPFLDAVNAWYQLPPKLLFAIGSRETNLTNEIGDGGHGFGVFQRDNRSHQVDASYLQDVHRQAADAADLLVRNFAQCRSWQGAAAMYNSGQPNDAYTTGHDYGADVMGRLSCLITNRVRIGLPVMFNGSTGDPVRFLQNAMNLKRMPGTPLQVDGVYGPATEAAVRGFQLQHGLTPDGVAGVVTLAVMTTVPLPR